MGGVKFLIVPAVGVLILLLFALVDWRGRVYQLEGRIELHASLALLENDRDKARWHFSEVKRLGRELKRVRYGPFWGLFRRHQKR